MNTNASCQISKMTISTFPKLCFLFIFSPPSRLSIELGCSIGFMQFSYLRVSAHFSNDGLYTNIVHGMALCDFELHIIYFSYI